MGFNRGYNAGRLVLRLEGLKMARQPRTRRITAQDFELEIQPPSALEEAIERENSADDDAAAEIVNAISSVFTADTKLMIYRIDPRTNKGGYVDTMHYPIEVEKLLENIKNEYGGGNYDLRVIGKRGVVTRRPVTIEGPPKIVGNTPVVQLDTSKDMFGMMLQMQQSSKSDMIMMMQAQSQQQAEDRRAAQQQQANNTQLLIGLATVAIPAIIPLFNKPGGGVKEMIETMGAAKSLFDGGGGGGDEGWLGTAAKSLMPMLADGMKNAQGQQQATQEQPQQPMLTAPVTTAPTITPTYPLPNAIPDNPILRLVGPDVLFMCHRGFNPDLAAEAVADTLNNNGLGFDDIQPLVLQFSTSQDWVADLAGQGIDLTGNRPWAEQFMAELVRHLSENNPADGTPSGNGGGDADPGTDGKTGA